MLLPSITQDSLPSGVGTPYYGRTFTYKIGAAYLGALAAKKSKAPAKPKQYTKAEFLKAVSDKTNMPQTDLEKALGGILGQIKKILGKGESIAFVGFGKFSVADRAARDGRNPQTGETLKIPASKTAKFTPGKELKEAVNKKKKK